MGATTHNVSETALAITGGLFGLHIIASYGMSMQGYALELLSGTPITFVPRQAQEAIIEPAFQRPEIQAMHNVFQDIVAEERVPYMQRLEKITLLDAGCGTGKTDKQITMDEVVWNPSKVKIWLHQCADDLESIFFVWGLKKGIDRKDLTSTEFIQYAMEILEEAAMNDALRIGWFASKTIDTAANGGVLLNASDIPNYNQINGLWGQIMANAATYTISENAGVDFTAQMNLANDRALLVFRNLLEKSDRRLKSAPDKEIFCTTELFENWLTYKESQNFDRSFERQDNGYQTDVYRGVKITAIDFWSRHIAADLQNGTKYYRPHRLS